jgi:y4mF family transcriptional regulator
MRVHAYEGGTMQMKDIGELIKQTRKSFDLRQDELASVAGIGTRTLSEIENGKETAHIGLVLKVLDCLAIEIKLRPMVATTADIEPTTTGNDTDHGV